MARQLEYAGIKFMVDEPEGLQCVIAFSEKNNELRISFIEKSDEEIEKETLHYEKP